MSFAHLLTETISYARRTGVSAAGDPTFGTVSTCAAMIERRARIGETEAGSDSVVYSATELRVGDRVWLPGASTSDANAAEHVRATVGMRSPDGLTIWQSTL